MEMLKGFLREQVSLPEIQHFVQTRTVYDHFVKFRAPLDHDADDAPSKIDDLLNKEYPEILLQHGDRIVLNNIAKKIPTDGVFFVELSSGAPGRIRLSDYITPANGGKKFFAIPRTMIGWHQLFAGEGPPQNLSWHHFLTTRDRELLCNTSAASSASDKTSTYSGFEKSFLIDLAGATEMTVVPPMENDPKWMVELLKEDYVHISVTKFDETMTFFVPPRIWELLQDLQECGEEMVVEASPLTIASVRTSMPILKLLMPE